MLTLDSRLHAQTVIHSHSLPRSTLRPPTSAAAAAQIVKPLWEPFVGLFPELVPLLDNLNRNCDYYLQEGQRLEQRRLSSAAAVATASSTDDVKNEAGGGGGGGGGGDKEGLKDASKEIAMPDWGGSARLSR